ncbi:MAG: HDOD domain-containing protein [Chloroflexi bacterium]|nr:HDOD domain-containing protein [Chloroflexota bacterium]
MPATDPYAGARAELFARIERSRTARPDLPTLEELLTEVAELQPLPVVAQRILRLDDSDRFSAHELATLIASHQVMTARVLRLANSAYYGVGRRIGTVRDAVVLLGFRSVRQVALTGCFIDARRPVTHLRYEEFWQFSIATGLLAEMLARTAGQHQGQQSHQGHQGEALSAGVLHNIGLLALDQHRPHVLGEVLERLRTEGETRHDAERALLGFTDADLGGALATHWNFPTTLVDAVQQHASLDHLPEPDSLAALVIRARLFARSYGLRDGLPDGDDHASTDDTLAAALERSGGIKHLLERVDAFLAATLG